MRTPRILPCVGFLALLASSGGRADEAAAKPDEVRAAASKALALIEKSTGVYRSKRTCFSCHHHTLPLHVLTVAKKHGFAIDEENYQTHLDRTHDHLRRGKGGYLRGRGQGGGVDTAGWGLWALRVGERKPDEVTAAVVEYLLRSQRGDRWVGTRTRGPTQESHVSRTVVSVRGLDAYGTEKQQDRIAEAKKKALAWLLRVKTPDTEDKVSRLRGLRHLGAEEKEIRAAAKELLLGQREDGGWAQRPDMESDAYATGTVLATLHEAGGLAVEDPAYRRGVRFLLSTQQEDGSWEVRSRSNPFQTYFESGFPHGTDQFISIAASCWATTALILTTAEGPAGAGEEKK